MSTTRVLGSKSPDCFQFRDPNIWICSTEFTSDVIVEVGDMSFHLHKFPLINRSGTLQKLINESTTDDNDGGGIKQCNVHLDGIPGGADAFEFVARFCYDVRVELNAANVVPLRCAAQHLRMTSPDYGEGNLVEQTESFLRDDVLASWDGSVRALLACDGVLPDAEELLIVSRCIESLASKACTDPTLFGWSMLEHYTAKNLEETVVWNGISTAGKPRSPGAGWWYRQASALRLPVYKRLISEMRSRGMSPEIIAGSLTDYAERHLSSLNRHSSQSDVRPSGAAVLSEDDQRVLLEEIVALLPAERGVATTRFLLRLLRTATILWADAACRDALETRIGNQLEEAALEDLLIPNTGYSADALYDVDSMQRMLEQFLRTNASAFPPSSPEIAYEGGQMVDAAPPAELLPVSTVAKLVDGYLAEVGTDTGLSFSKIQTIAALVPDYARALDDGLYRAIDIYFKAHPRLTNSEREQLCRLMNCQKLSLEACTHAAQNERLPLRVVVQVLFFEQLRLRTTMAGWFFMSDNADQGGSPGSSRRHAPRKSRGELDFAAGWEEEEEGAVADDDAEAYAAGSSGQASAMSVEEVRQRVVELEGECSSMRQEIHRLGKPKGALSRLFRKLGLGGRSSSSPSSPPRVQKQLQPQHQSTSGGEKYRFLGMRC